MLLVFVVVVKAHMRAQLHDAPGCTVAGGHMLLTGTHTRPDGWAPLYINPFMLHQRKAQQQCSTHPVPYSQHNPMPLHV